MRQFPVIIFMVLLFLTAGCAATTVTFYDRNSQAHISRMSGNRLAGGITTVELNGQRFEKDGSPSYSLFIVYLGPTFINIGVGKTLVLIIDGQRFEVSGQGSEHSRTIVSIGLIEEKAYYHDITPDLIRMLAYAREVEVEIIGSSSVLNRSFRKKNFINFKDFFESYVKPYAGS